MVNAPPTPPPTTAVELQDEARSTASTSAQATSSDSIRDPLQQKFPIIADLAMNSDFHRLTELAEEMDLNASSGLQLKRLLVTAPLVLGYLILDELPLARYALERLSDVAASHPLALGLYGLVMYVKHRQHTKVYSTAQSLLDSTARDDFFDKNLSIVVASMLSSFVEHFRQRTFALLSKSYISLPVPLASIYLGMPADQVIVAAQAHQWSYDPSTQVLGPATTEKNRITSPSVSSISTFHFVVDSVGKLEL